MTYPGGKNGAGVYQRIINLMPPHETYIEPFLGGGAILRLKRPAAFNIGVDLDPAVIRAWLAVDRDRATSETAIRDLHHHRAETAMPDPDARRQYLELASLEMPRGSGKFKFIHQDGLEYLRGFPPGRNDLVYCDPPYLHSTRGRSNLYRCEMTDAQHRELLDVIWKLPCMVMISGYWSTLYARKLKGWNSTTFQAMTRAGRPATEWLWFNFPEPVALHDYSYLGEGFRERERIKRKKLRWVNRLKRMPLLEKRALLGAIAEGVGR